MFEEGTRPAQRAWPHLVPSHRSDHRFSSQGTHTCALRFGSLGYEKLDADAYAAWGFDYLKYDNCFSAGQYGTPSASFARYKAMSDALVATGRDIFYSLCNWGQVLSALLPHLAQKDGPLILSSLLSLGRRTASGTGPRSSATRTG